MNIIKRRIEKLESAASKGGHPIEMIIRRIIKTDSNGKATCAKYADTLFYRAPDESEDEFIDRAQAEVMATAPKGIPRLIVSETDLAL